MHLRKSITDEVFFNAYLRRDRSFEGIFFLGVKTTGVFCRPGCVARAPRRENIELFESTTEALAAGFRPCKKCQPLQLKDEPPLWVEQAMHLLQVTPDQRVSDEVLQQNGIDPVRLRRWFKSHHDMTFQQYQRQLKIADAGFRIHKGSKVIDAAMDSGYYSISGFNERFRQITGNSPKQIKNNCLFATKQLLTPLGPMIAAASDAGICFLEFTDRKYLQRQVDRVQRLGKGIMVPGQHALLDEMQSQLDGYFSGQRQQFDIPLNLYGSEFQQQVWKSLQKIPYGQTRSYQYQAEVMGNPRAVRAMATANAANPVAIVVPCHRVIGKSGSMAGYAGGVWRKHYLVRLETTA